MRRYALLLGLALVTVVAVMAALPDPAPSIPMKTVSGPAPDFTLTDTNGRTHTLSQYRGKFVVLEWLNFDCPYVRKHYNGRNMQTLQERYTDRGVVWLSIVSSARGEQGHFSNEEMNRRARAHGAHQTAILIDEPGRVGRLYGARTTPQMFVISPEGQILYNGAIDDKPSPNPATLETARSYFSEAMDAALAGRAVPVASTQPYGCNVKYAAAVN